MASQLGIVGTGERGAGLARAFAARGRAVAVFDPTDGDAKEFVAALDKPPFIVIAMEPDENIDAALGQMTPRLPPGAIVVDAGDSPFRDSMRRADEMARAGAYFLDLGVAGGGGDSGLSLMAGGDADAYRQAEPFLLDLAARVLGRPCCGRVGASGAGHFAKMVHDALECAGTQLTAEGFALLRDLVALDYPDMRDVFARWNEGELESRLLEAAADVVGGRDDDSGHPLCETVPDQAAPKPAATWASRETLYLGVAAPTLIEAVQARDLSLARSGRVAASKKLAGPRARFAGDPAAFAAEIGEALYAAGICCHAQAIALLRAGGARYGWRIDMEALSRLWRGGSGVASRFLQRVGDAYRRDPALGSLFLDDYCAGILERSHGAWRRVAAAAVGSGLPTPALLSALAHYDGFRSVCLPANLVRALESRSR